MLRQVKSALRFVCCFAGMACVTGSAMAAALPPDASQWKTDASVPDMPKYTIGQPAYFVPANVVATWSSPHSGALTGTTTTTVYRNPANNLLSFDYVIAADPGNTRFIIRASLDGPWLGVNIADTGSDIGGISGTGDPLPEWTTGDPIFITRDRFTEAPAWQYRMAVGSTQVGTVVGPGNTSSHVWFETNATDYTESVVGFIDSGAIGQAGVFVPVPDPGTLALLALGSAAIIRRRRA